MPTNGSASRKRGKNEDGCNYQEKAAFPTTLCSIHQLRMTFMRSVIVETVLKGYLCIWY